MRLQLLAVLLTTLVAPHAAVALDQEAQDAPTVEVLDAGEGELRRLRYEVQPDAVLRLTASMEQSNAITIDDLPMPEAASPTLEFDMSMRVVELLEDGDFACEVVIERFDALPTEGVEQRVLDVTNLLLDQLQGIRMTFVSTDRGVLLGGDVEAREDLVPSLRPVVDQMRDTMRSSQVVLPEEAVGLGGKWRTTDEIEAGGMRMRLTTVYTITDLNDEGVELSVFVEQDAAPHQVQLPGVAPEVDVQLVSLAGAGAGRSVLRFDMPNPVAAEMEVTTSVTMEVAEPGLPAQSVKTDAAVTITMHEPGDT